MKNFTLLTLLFLYIPIITFADNSNNQKGIDFKTVAEALSFLKNKPSVSFSTTKPDGWIIVDDPEAHSLWSFTPESHKAHPAVIRREVKQNDEGNVYIETKALCQADKDSCDNLMEDFKALDNNIRKEVQKKLGN